VRNGFGEVIREVSPDRGSSIYYYDAAGAMSAAIDGRGQRTDYARDVLGRMISATPVGRPASEVIAYSYDTGGFGSYQIGRLAKVTDGTGETRFEYDHRGNMLQRSQTVGSTTNANLAYTYDLADRIASVRYPSGREVRYNRDGKGRVSGVETRGSATAAWVGLASSLSYDPFGPVTIMALGNGLNVANDRGIDGRLSARRLTRVVTGEKLSDLTYRYDPDGNIGGIDDAVVPERSALYGYDSAGRLTLTVAEGAATAQTYNTSTGTNRLASITSPAGTRSIAYDGRGNPATEARPGGIAVTTAYDGHGRLTSYARTGEANLTHSYNGLDDRVATTSVNTSGTDTRRFVYAPDGRVLGEYGANASDVKAEFIWASPEVGDTGQFGGDDGLGGYMPLAVAANDNLGMSQLTWVHGNHMGVPAVFTDASGTELSIPTGYALPGFPGQSRTLTDLYYNRHRDYDPTTGRYIQADPVGLAGGANPYSYAMNNPLRYTDSKGLFLDTLADIGFVLYDLYRIGNDNIFGDYCEGESLESNLTALGLDVAGVFVPFVSGGGVASRAARNASNLQDASRVARQRASRAQRREARSRSGADGAKDQAGNPQKAKGDGFRNHEDANKGPAGERPKGPDRSNNRERNQGIDEEHNIREKGQRRY
jgi:RHS repeat-associated protein